MLKSYIKHYTDKLPLPLRNKFVVVICFFLIWMAIFDKHSLYKQIRLQSTLKELKSKLAYYKEEIKNDTEKGLELSSDEKGLEKFAREEHLMKKDDEEIFVIVPKKK
jgi:cell division protein DivIC